MHPEPVAGIQKIGSETVVLVPAGLQVSINLTKGLDVIATQLAIGFDATQSVVNMHQQQQNLFETDEK